MARSTVERARSAFEATGNAVQDVSGRAADIASAIGQLSDDADQMAADVVGVATVAESASASSEQVSASTQQTSASTQEIAASAQDLAASASELERVVATFRLGTSQRPAAQCRRGRPETDMVRQMGCSLYGESTPFHVRGTPTYSSLPMPSSIAAIVRITRPAASSSSSVWAARPSSQ